MNWNSERMRGAFPQTPEPVKRRMAMTLAQIHREAATLPPKRCARRLSLPAVALLIVALVTAAVATGAHFGVFDFMTKLLGTSGVLPEARELVQQNLGSLELAHTTLNVDEAVYDGGALHVVYSITLRGATAPLTEQDAEDPQSVFNRAIAADRALTMCDSFWLNGTEHSMTNGSFGDTMPGADNGELLCYLSIQLASAGIVPDGDFTVRLPLAGGGGAYQTLDFTVKADANHRQPVVLYGEQATVTLQSAFLSPVRTYVGIRVEINADVPKPQADGIITDWAEAEMVDAQGNELAGLIERVLQNMTSGMRAEYSYVFPPVEAAEAYLAPTYINERGEWTVDMSRALPLQ